MADALTELPHDLIQKLSLYGQNHLVRFWDQLDARKKRLLLQDLDELNLEQLLANFNQATFGSELTGGRAYGLLEPLPGDSQVSTARLDEANLISYEEIGLNSMAKGETAMLLLAGGQATRLGIDYPKGMYDVGLPSGKTLFQLQAEQILKLKELASSKFANLTSGRSKHTLIPWYIMTSKATHDQTMSFFQRQNFFGLEQEDVLLFKQNTIPCLDPKGKILMEETHKIARAPDGNGGLYKAIEQCRMLDDMRRRGVQYVHVFCVDNILVKVGDPAFIGYCIEKGAECGSKVVEKSEPRDGLGVLCKVNGEFKFLKDSEIPWSIAERRSCDGRLIFGLGNICDHFFTVPFLQDVIDRHETKLKHHVAYKKINFINEGGQKVRATKANGIKMEKFVFDVFPFAKKFVAWEVAREDEFAPLKNSDGSLKKTPSTSRDALIRLHVKRMLRAGATFQDSQGRLFPHLTKENSVDFDALEMPICEISPLVSYAGEGLESIVKNRCFQSPLHLDVQLGNDHDDVVN